VHAGIDLHPHLFRHIAAWFILRENPGDRGMVQRVLGHRSIAAADAYSGLEAFLAVERFDTLIKSLREAEQPPAKARRPLGRRKKRGS